MPGREGEDANLTRTSLVQGAPRRSEPGTDPWGQFGEALTSPMTAEEEWACREG